MSTQPEITDAEAIEELRTSITAPQCHRDGRRSLLFALVGLTVFASGLWAWCLLPENKAFAGFAVLLGAAATWTGGRFALAYAGAGQALSSIDGQRNGGDAGSSSLGSQAGKHRL